MCSHVYVLVLVPFLLFGLLMRFVFLTFADTLSPGGQVCIAFRMMLAACALDSVCHILSLVRCLPDPFWAMWPKGFSTS